MLFRPINAFIQILVHPEDNAHKHKLEGVYGNNTSTSTLTVVQCSFNHTLDKDIDIESIYVRLEQPSLKKIGDLQDHLSGT